MAIIDPEGLFNGDRLRRCSNAAQLHFPRLFLASDGFARLEINYAKVLRAYATFNPIPSETEIQGWLQEYAHNFLLFLYQVDGQLWGQWDTRKELLPRYKTAADRRSPAPPEPAFSEWKQAYRIDNRVFPKSFGKISETFLHGVGKGEGIGVGKNICASPDGNARMGLLASTDDPPFVRIERGALFVLDPEEKTDTPKAENSLSPEQEGWFTAWWQTYWRRVARKDARAAFRKHVTTKQRFQQVLSATRAQSAEMLARPKDKRPHGSTWLNGERWTDEIVDTAVTQASATVYRKLEMPA